MTTWLHLGIEETRSFRALPLTILAWLETTALKFELTSFIKRSRESDRWFLSRGEETFGPVPIEKVLRLLLLGEGPIPVLHESEVEMEPAPWHLINYRPWPLNAVAAIAWIAGFWLLAVGLGFVVVTLVCPVPARPFVGAAYLLAIAATGIWLSLRGPRATTSESETPADAEPPAVESD